MSDTATATDEGHGHGHGAHYPEHEYPFVAHHFDDPQQQFDSGKLGIWLFLVTEVLFFAGLFCAYSLYRSMHPEIFVWAHYYLDTNMGAINTCVLILSSLTAAWSVRNAQLKQQGALVLNIVITIACACTFMVVKYFEYSHKFHDGLLPGPRFKPTEVVWETPSFKEKHPHAAELAEHMAHAAKAGAANTADGKAAEAKPVEGKAVEAKAEHGAAGHGAAEHGAAAEPLKLTVAERREALHELEKAGVIGPRAEGVAPSRPRGAHVFFGIYFFMTGLHGVHVLVGIGIWIWLLLRAMKGQFGPLYFGPIDYAALYWHLVDLIWIYLFPLLYLIH